MTTRMMITFKIGMVFLVCDCSIVPVVLVCRDFPARRLIVMVCLNSYAGDSIFLAVTSDEIFFLFLIAPYSVRNESKIESKIITHDNRSDYTCSLGLNFNALERVQ